MRDVGDAGLEKLLREAQGNRKPVSIEMARSALGELFDERALADQTVVLHGDDIALTPSSWYRIVRQAASRSCGGTGRC